MSKYRVSNLDKINALSTENDKLKHSLSEIVKDVQNLATELEVLQSGFGLTEYGEGQLKAYGNVLAIITDKTK